MATKDKYCLLPDGNRSEFPELDSELRRRNVRALYIDLPSGGRMYWFPAKELKKLPKDKRGRYLGDDNSGHSIYPFPDAEDYLKKLGVERVAWTYIL